MNSDVKKTVQSDKFPGLFTLDELENPTAWNKSRSEVEPLVSPKLGVSVSATGTEDASDDILKSAAQISEEMERKLLEEQNVDGLQVDILPNMIRALNPMKDFKAYLDLKKYFKEQKFDVVHTHA